MAGARKHNADEHANVLENLASQAFKNDERVPALMDVPISVVNQCVYLPDADQEPNGATASVRLRRPWPSQPNLASLPARAGPAPSGQSPSISFQSGPGAAASGYGSVAAAAAAAAAATATATAGTVPATGPVPVPAALHPSSQPA